MNMLDRWAANIVRTEDPEWCWWFVWLMLLAHALLFVAFGWMFEHHRLLIHTPILTFTAGLISACSFTLLLPWLVRRSVGTAKDQQQRILLGIVAGGVLLRLLMFWTPPALESDFYRYLWDGALTATGHNPYAYAPAKLNLPNVPQSVRDLAIEAGYIHERINHAELGTIYPPVAQAFFALAYHAEAWSLTSWRLICLLCELATLGALYRFLLQLSQSPLWLVLYWWNPLLIKELVNSVHMEAVLLPFLAGAALLAASRRPIAACIALALAAGVKIWPILIIPLVLRELWPKPRKLAVAIICASAIVLACATPPLLSSLDESSGFAAYATHWRRNGGLIVLLQALLTQSLDSNLANLVARGLVTVLAGITAVALAWRQIGSRLDLVRRMMLVALVVLLLSPAQFPWYAAWVMPFMVVAPLYGVFAMTALMPLYYTRFYLQFENQSWIYQDILVFTIWLPVWAILAVEFRILFIGTRTTNDNADSQ